MRLSITAQGLSVAIHHKNSGVVHWVPELAEHKGCNWGMQVD